jgi:hypothetical protein
MSNITNIAHGFHMSISALSGEFGLARETVRRRLADAKVEPSGKRSGYPVFRLKDAWSALVDGAGDQLDPDRLDPFKRRAFYQGEHEKLRLQLERRELIPRIEVEQDMAAMLKVTAECFDTLPDLLERDCGLKPAVLAKLEQSLDKAREELYQLLAADDDNHTEVATYDDSN